jgi:hypothetical protein
MFNQLSALAREEGKPVGTLARELLENTFLEASRKTPQSLARHFVRWASEIDWVEPELNLTIKYASQGLLTNSWLNTVGSASDVPWGAPASAIRFEGLFKPIESKSDQTSSSRSEDEEERVA